MDSMICYACEKELKKDDSISVYEDNMYHTECLMNEIPIRVIPRDGSKRDLICSACENSIEHGEKNFVYYKESTVVHDLIPCILKVIGAYKYN